MHKILKKIQIFLSSLYWSFKIKKTFKLFGLKILNINVPKNTAAIGVSVKIINK